MSTVLENRAIKKTRKSWQCDGCYRKFEAGGPKNRQRGIGDDGPYTWETCDTCQGISEEIWAKDSKWREGVSAEDIQEDMYERFKTWDAADAHYAIQSGLCSVVPGEGGAPYQSSPKVAKKMPYVQKEGETK